MNEVRKSSKLGRVCVSAVVLGVAAVGTPGSPRGVEVRMAAADDGGSCALHGSPVMPKSASIYDAASGGSAVVTFTEQPVELTVSQIPADATAGRAKVRTGGGIRVEGFIDPQAVPTYAARDLPVVLGHVWIAEGRKVRVTGTADGSLKVQAKLSGSIAQTLSATAPCDALTLTKRPRPAWDVPGNARGYVAKTDTLELHDGAGGPVVFTLEVGEPGGGLLMWSTEARKGYVHVMAHEDAIIDGWVPQRQLTALKRGEMMDQVAPPESVVAPARLAVEGKPIVVKALREVPLRLTTSDQAKPVGVVEAGGEVYVMETITGWSSVLPHALNVLPAGDRSFWVRAAEIGLSPAAAPPAK